VKVRVLFAARNLQIGVLVPGGVLVLHGRVFLSKNFFRDSPLALKVLVGSRVVLSLSKGISVNL